MFRRRLATCSLVGLLLLAGIGLADAQIFIPGASVLRYFWNVKETGAAGDCVKDDTAAIQATYDRAGERSIVYFPAGCYRTTGTILIKKDRVFTFGAGPQSTRIDYRPAAAGSAFRVQADGGAMLTQGGFRDLAGSSGDATVTKTFLELVDTSGYVVEHIATYPWTGNGSIAIRTRGREFTQFRDLYLRADRPLVLSPDPNIGSISVDHFNFHNLYLTGETAYPLIEIESNTYVTNVSFTGAQAWVRGAGGLLWNDTQTTVVGLSLIIENVRYEQPQSVTGYFVSVTHNTALQGLTIRNCNVAPDTRGIYLRKVRFVLLENTIYADANGRIGLDVDATVYPVTMVNAWWQSSTVLNIAGLTKVLGSGQSAIGGPGGGNNLLVYDLPSSAVEVVTVGNQGGILLPSVAFAALPAPAIGNGQILYCTNCTVANPCAGGGAGAFAKRINGAWVCN